MADKFIQQLTHNNETFEQQWCSIAERLENLFNECNQKMKDIQGHKVKALDALADYVLSDSPSLKPFNMKFLFIERVAMLCATEPQPVLADLVLILRRILDQPNIFNEWHFSFIEEIYKKFEIGTRLSEKPSKDLIESILKSLQKQSFLIESSYTECEDRWIDFFTYFMFSSGSYATNQLATEATMLAVRPAFQQFFGYAVQMSSKSNVWSKVAYLLQNALPNLFDSSANPADALAIIEDSDSSVSREFLRSVAKSYKDNVNQFKANFSHVLTIIEPLVLANRVYDARDFMEETIDIHFKTAVDIGILVEMFIRVCEKVNVTTRGELCEQIIFSLSRTLENTKCNKTLAPLLFDFAIVILDLKVFEAPQYLAPRFSHVVRSCAAYDIIDDEDHFSHLHHLEGVLELTFERSKVCQNIVQATHNEALQAILRWLGPAKPIKKVLWCSHVYRMGRNMVDLIDQRQVIADVCGQLIEALHKRIIKNKEDDDEDQTDDTHEDFCITLASKLADYIEKLKSLPQKVHRQIASFILAALALPLKCESGEESCARKMAKLIWLVIGLCIKNENEARFYEQCLKQIHSLAHEYDEEDFFQWWMTFWSAVGIQTPSIAANYVEDFLSDLLDRKRIDLCAILPKLYPIRPEPFHSRLSNLVDGIFSNDQAYSISVSYLFSIVGKEHPELFTSKHVDHVFASMKSCATKSDGLIPILEALGFVANAQPHLFHKHHDQLLHLVSKQQNVSAFHCLQQYYVASTIVNEGKTANEYLTILINILRQNSKMKNDIRKQIFHVCELIGVINKQALEAKRKDLVAFQTYAECRLLLDFIYGKKLSAENQEVLNQTRQEIGQMEKLVVKTGKYVQNVTTVVRRQEINVTNLNTRVKKVDTKLNNVNEQLQVHTNEIERIDAKTLSHIPTEWGDQVSKLLNHRADNDWRLLGKRFGYSTSELRHWSMHANPCMSLLNEWFMTYKADEATYGLVKMLDEIGRKDASKIIRQAAATAGELIPDDMPFEIKRLPQIFLSYQWGAQKAVKTLKQNLEEAGYACWMDIGQMGGWR
ncbi:unnamed protein product [Rotaria sp. Silwood2]|nr:unnamed protein product [Rotaria sp. Silwood2]